MTANPESSADTEWWQWDERALWEAGKELETRRRADYVSEVEVVAELWDRTGRAKEDRVAIVADLTGWGLTPGEARELLRHAELFRREPIREAARAGMLSKEHLKVIDKTLAEVPEADRDKVEATLLEDAAKFDGASLKKIALRILQHLDQDGKAPDDRELAEPKREFHYSSRRDGSVVFRGHIDPESGAKLAALMSPLAKPKSGQDPRTTAERQGDAFAEIIEMASASEDLPEEGGERPHLALMMSVKEFLELRGTAEVEGMGPMNAASARRIACDSKVMRAVIGANSEVLDIGRLYRTIPNQIRRALVLRDKGCAFPGCGTRPRQCHGHHVIHWANGGPTSLGNLVLLCGQHHRLMHHGNWTVKIKDGLPVFANRLMEARSA
jgi:hypothetical protein